LAKCCAPVRRSNCCKGESDEEDDQYELKAKISKDYKVDASLSEGSRSDGGAKAFPQSHMLQGKREKESDGRRSQRIPALEVALATHVGDGGREEQSSERSFGEDLEIFPPDFNSAKMGQFRGKLRKENQQMRTSFKGGIQEIQNTGVRTDGAAEFEDSEVLEDPTLLSQISNISDNSMKEARQTITEVQAQKDFVRASVGSTETRDSSSLILSQPIDTAVRQLEKKLMTKDVIMRAVGIIYVRKRKISGSKWVAAWLNVQGQTVQVLSQQPSILQANPEIIFSASVSSIRSNFSDSLDKHGRFPFQLQNLETKQSVEAAAVNADQLKTFREALREKV